MKDKPTNLPLFEVCSIRAQMVDPTLPETRKLPHINGSNIESKTGKLRAVRSAGEDGMQSPKFGFKKGDILYSKLRPNLRKAVIAPFDGLCSADMYPLTPNKELVVPDYLLVLLLSDQFTAYAIENSARARMPKLNRESLFSFHHNFPTLRQQNIATELNEQLSIIDTAVQAADKRVAAAEAMEAAFFREFFHGITPVVIGTPKEAAPAGWEWHRLSKLAELESGHTPSRKQPEWWGGEIPWISLPDIRALDGRVAMKTKENTNPLGIANSSARILPAGTVMLSRTASVGFVAMMGRPMATSQDFVNWVCGDGLAPRFLMHALRASREYLLANASGAIHKTIYMPAVKEFNLCLPDRKTQDKLTERLDGQLLEAASVLAAARRELAAIQTLPAAVLRRVFEPTDVTSV